MTAPTRDDAPRLTGLSIYPIKGAGGISVESAELDTFGLHLDRRCMVVDLDGVFLSQREIPRLSLVRVHLADDSLIVSAPNRPPLTVPLMPPSGPTVRVTVWSDEVDGRDAGPTAASWFSAVLGLDCSLVHMDEETLRPVDRHYASGAERVSFADGFPLLLISEGSLRLQNERLSEPVPMNRFRPNLVVDGVEAHAEDDWSRIQIGDIALDVVKPCARCAVTTTDQATGVRGKEPLRTLATYRNVNGQVMFGQNVIHRGLGRLSIGDRVEIA